MQIIIVESDKRLRDMFSVNLTQSLGADVIPSENANEAWAMIELLEPAMIIAKDRLDSELTVKTLVEKLNDANSSIPIISLGLETQIAHPLLTVLPENTNPELLAKTALAIVKREQKKLNRALQEENKKDQGKHYRPVPLSLFKFFAKVPYDIYLRLKRGEEFQFLKRINANEGYDLMMLEGYAKKKVTHLYIHKDHYNEFTTLVNKRFKELLNDIHTASKSKEEIQAYVLEQLTATGFNESNLQLAQDSIEKINNKIQNADSKLSLLNEIYKSQLGYRFRRSYMISVISSIMIKNIDWGDLKHSEYLTMAAYVHDMFLETDEEMNIMSDMELEQAFLGDEHERVENHAMLAADKLKTDVRIPSEVEKIVRQHHGSHSGVGFPNEISPQVQKLGVLFLAAEEFTIALLNSPRSKINLNEVFTRILDKFPSNTELPKCLDALKKCLKK